MIISSSYTPYNNNNYKAPSPVNYTYQHTTMAMAGMPDQQQRDADKERVDLLFWRSDKEKLKW